MLHQGRRVLWKTRLSRATMVSAPMTREHGCERATAAALTEALWRTIAVGSASIASHSSASGGMQVKGPSRVAQKVAPAG